MPHRDSLNTFLEDYFSIHLIEDHGPNGLQIQGSNEVSSIATAVSASYETINKAVEKKVDALFVHHGLFWNKDPYPIVKIKKEKVDLLLKNNISLFAFHLPLDAHPIIGNNWGAAKRLGWKTLSHFGKKYAEWSLGVAGTFQEVDVEVFQKGLEDFYQHKANVALGGKRKVKTAALISGGAHWSIKEAVDQKIDCFITGSFDEPIWHIAHEEKINFFALGHSNTEEIGIQLLGQLLEKEFKLKHFFIDVPNPF